MMNRYKAGRHFLPALAMVFLCLMVQATWAHFLWFKPPATVKPGDKMPVKIYFGEYHESLREVRGGRLDERQGTMLRVIAPSGDSQAFPLKQEADHFYAPLSVGESGVYDLLATDTTNAVVDWTKYGIGIVRPIFYARSRFLSFQAESVSERTRAPQPILDLDILPVTRHLDVRSGAFGPAVGEEMVFRVFFKGKSLTERAEINVYSPNGWLWSARIDSDGIGRVTPLWPGAYVIEVIYIEKNPGEFGGNSYEAVRHRATLSIMTREQDQ